MGGFHSGGGHRCCSFGFNDQTDTTTSTTSATTNSATVPITNETRPAVPLLETNTPATDKPASKHDNREQVSKTEPSKPPPLPLEVQSTRTRGTVSPFVHKVRELPPLKRFGKLAARLGADTLSLKPCGEGLVLNGDAQPLWFETSLFVGRVVLRIHKAAGAMPTKYFDGRKRSFSCQIEGMFKKRICTNNVYFGAAFDKPLKLPGAAKIALKLLKALNPNMREDMSSDTPYIMAPLLSCQKMEVRKPAVVGELGPWRFGGAKVLEEDSALLVPMALRKGWREKKRKIHFRKEAHRKVAFFNPAFVYSFDLFSQAMDFVTLQVRVATVKLKVSKLLNEQPLRFEFRVYDDNKNVIGQLLSFEVLHEDVCPALMCQ